MSTEIAYIDESYDDEKFCMSVLIVPVARWREDFNTVKDWRRNLRTRYGIFVNKELHATDFVAGRGKIGHRMVPKALRAQIFLEAMDLLASLDEVAVISGVWSKLGLTHAGVHTMAFSRIQERLQRRCQGTGGHILRFVDKGRKDELRKVSRRSAVFNPVGSQFGYWPEGASRNIPNTRLIEDPVFRDSESSYFLQLADFVAFALLKSEVAPTPLIRRHGLDQAYERLRPICVVVAHHADPRGLGILRS